MSTSFALLGLLDRQASYGYELKKAYDKILGAGKPLAFGQVYATLSRLRRDGRVSVVPVTEIPETETSGGPERVKYEITTVGTHVFHEWLRQPEPAAPHLQVTMYAKVVLALLGDSDPNRYLDAQRRHHIARMRELTRERTDAPLSRVLLLDHALYHLEADLRWIELTSARLTQLKEDLHS